MLARVSSGKHNRNGSVKIHGEVTRRKSRGKVGERGDRMGWPRFIVSDCMTQRDYGGQGKFFFCLLFLVFLLLVFNFLFRRI